MDQTIIGELNQKYRIYYPYEEISIYLQDSKLSDSPVPAFTKLLIAPANFYPTKISFKIAAPDPEVTVLRCALCWKTQCAC